MKINMDSIVNLVLLTIFSIIFWLFSILLAPASTPINSYFFVNVVILNIIFCLIFNIKQNFIKDVDIGLDEILYVSPLKLRKIFIFQLVTNYIKNNLPINLIFLIFFLLIEPILNIKFILLVYLFFYVIIYLFINIVAILFLKLKNDIVLITILIFFIAIPIGMNLIRLLSSSPELLFIVSLKSILFSLVFFFCFFETSIYIIQRFYFNYLKSI